MKSKMLYSAILLIPIVGGLVKCFWGERFEDKIYFDIDNELFETYHIIWTFWLFFFIAFKCIHIS